MKRILLFIIPSVVALGCDNNDGKKSNACGLELKLVKTTSSWTGEEATGDDMSWQETIVLSDDSTFFKRRNDDGAITEASGHYSYVTRDGKDYVELTYDQGGEVLRSNCEPEPTDLIEVKSSTQFINAAWQRCDGPILEYEAHTALCGE